MTKSAKSGAAIVAEKCKEQQVNIEDVEAILKLYGSDMSEEEIEKATNKYPDGAIELASGLSFGII